MNNIMAIRTRLNYGARGSLYYKKRNEDDPATASLVALDFEEDVELMVECTAAEKKVTLVFSEKDFKNKDCVEITPVKRRRVNESQSAENGDDGHNSDDDFLADYQNWLEKKKRHGLGMYLFILCTPSQTTCKL